MSLSWFSERAKVLLVIAIMLMIYIPIWWGVAFSYRIVDVLPWPGVALYSHFGLMLALVLLLFNLKKLYISNRLFFSFVLFYWCVSFLYSIFYLAVSPDVYAGKAFFQSVVYLFYYLGFLIVAFYVFQVSWNAWLVLSMVLFYIVLSFFELNPAATIPVSLYSIYGSFNEAIPNYQLVSLSVLFTAILLLQSGLRFKAFFVLCILTLVFLTGGRSEFLGSVITLFFIYCIKFFVVLFKRLSINKVTLIVLMVFISLLFFMLYLYFNDSFFFANNRNFQIFSLSDASSWQGRQEIFQKNIGHIVESPIFGKFGSHFHYGEGSYIHNILSVWQQYGIIPFVVYFSILLFPVISLFLLYAKNEDSFVLVPLAVSFYCLLLMLVSKSYQWSYAGLSAGAYFYVCYYYSSRVSQEVSR